MRFSLIPRDTTFFDMFDEYAATVTQAAGKFHEMVTVFDRLETRCRDLKSCEDACDAHVAKIITSLGRTFITPFDREDIHTLATRIDEVMNNMEKTAYRLDAFRIENPTPATTELARIVKECCIRLETAIKLLRDMRNSEKIQVLLREIGKLENDADRVYRHADAALFSDLVEPNGNGGAVAPIDVLALIMWREIYDWLEETVDACKHVANVISEIVIKAT
jgi:uncharacterized protein